LIALEGLLIGNINNVSGSDIVQEVFLAPEGFLFLFFLYHSADVVLVAAWLKGGRDEFGVDDIRIVPLGLTGLPMFIIQFFTRNPLLIVGCLVED
jgi:hypothetical protein